MLLSSLWKLIKNMYESLIHLLSYILPFLIVLMAVSSFQDKHEKKERKKTEERDKEKKRISAERAKQIRNKEREDYRKREEDRLDKMANSAAKLVPISLMKIKPFVDEYINEMPKSEVELLKTYKSKILAKKALIEVGERAENIYCKKIQNEVFEKLRYKDKSKNIFKRKVLTSAINSSSSIFTEILSEYLVRNYSIPLDIDNDLKMNRPNTETNRPSSEMNSTSSTIKKTRKWEE